MVSLLDGLRLSAVLVNDRYEDATIEKRLPGDHSAFQVLQPPALRNVWIVLDLLGLWDMLTIRGAA